MFFFFGCKRSKILASARIQLLLECRGSQQDNGASPMFICCAIREIELFFLLPSTKQFRIMFIEYDAAGFRKKGLPQRTTIAVS